MRYDHNRGLSCLEDTWISKANAKQRRGRAGRVRPGCCFRLFSRQQFEKFEEQQLPEMLRVSLEGLCLRVKPATALRLVFDRNGSIVALILSVCIAFVFLLVFNDLCMGIDISLKHY